MTSSRPASFLGNVVSFVFFAAAAFLLYLGLGTITWVYKAQTWVEVPANKIDGAMQTQRNLRQRAVVSRKVVGSYTYTWEGQEYRGSTMDFSPGANNFSDTRQTKQWRTLRSESFHVYVDPDNPSQSVLDRSFPAALLAFYSVFLVFPCFLGVVWFWRLPMAFGASEDGLIGKISSLGIAGTLLFPVASMLLFPRELGVFQWLVFVLVCAVVLGVRWGLRKIGREISKKLVRKSPQ